MFGHGEGGLLVASRIFYEYAADHETVREFRAPFWGRRRCPYLRSSELNVGVMSTYHQGLSKEVETSEFGPAEVITAD
jgi:hypothetical protein